MSRTRRPRPSQKQRLQFFPMCYFYFRLLRDVLRLIKWQISFFPFFMYRGSILYYFMRRRREASLCFRKKTKNCWNRCRTEELIRNVREKPYKDFYVVVYKWLCFWFCFEWPNFGADHVRGGRWLRGIPLQTFICSPSMPALPSSSSVRRAAVPIKWPCFSVLSVVLAERSLQNGLQYFESVASAFRQAPPF